MSEHAVEILKIGGGAPDYNTSSCTRTERGRLAKVSKDLLIANLSRLAAKSILPRKVERLSCTQRLWRSGYGREQMHAVPSSPTQSSEIVQR